MYGVGVTIYPIIYKGEVIVPYWKYKVAPLHLLELSGSRGTHNYMALLDYILNEDSPYSPHPLTIGFLGTIKNIKNFAKSIDKY